MDKGELFRRSPKKTRIKEGANYIVHSKMDNIILQLPL